MPRAALARDSRRLVAMITTALRRLPAPLLIAPALLLTAVLAGCDADTPEERLEEAAERVEDAREEAHDVRENVRERAQTLAERQAALARAEKKLQSARSRLSEAERDVAQARRRLDTRATDVAIFRQVQRELLEADALEGSALTATVENRVVTLSGVVDDAAARNRAIEIAESTPAVSDVRDRIRVEAAAADDRDDERTVRDAAGPAGDAS